MLFPAGNIRQLACVLWECAAIATDGKQKSRPGGRLSCCATAAAGTGVVGGTGFEPV